MTTLSNEELEELQAHAAADRVATADERSGDRAIARREINVAMVRRLRQLGLLSKPGEDGDLVTAMGREVLARQEAT